MQFDGDACAFKMDCGPYLPQCSTRGMVAAMRCTRFLDAIIMSLITVSAVSGFTIVPRAVCAYDTVGVVSCTCAWRLWARER